MKCTLILLIVTFRGTGSLWLIPDYLDKKVRAYGVSAVRFKDHQLLHLPEDMERNKRFLSCFTLERKHLGTKADADHHRQIGSFTRGALVRCLNSQAGMLKMASWRDHLEGSVPCPELLPPGATQAHVAANMRWHHQRLGHGDVVFLDLERTSLVVIVACVCVDGSYSLVVKACTRVSVAAFSSVWRIDGENALYELSDERVVKTSFHRYPSCDRIVVLH